MNYELERRKVEIEAEKLADSRAGERWTRLSIIIPLFIGFLAIFLQARTAYRLKQLESAAAFQLKAAEIILNSKGTKAGEERARALRQLFPQLVTDEFVKVFESNFKLPGTAYQEKKLELFKAMSSRIDERKEVFRIYAMLYSDEEAILLEFVDKWAKVYPEDTAWIAGFTQTWQAAFPSGRWTKKDSNQKSLRTDLRTEASASE